MKIMKKTADKLLACAAAGIAFVLNSVPTLADPTTAVDTNNTANVNDILKPLNVIKALSMGIVSTIGTIMIVWAILEIAQAVQAHDTSQIGPALKKLAGGLLCAGVTVVLGLMGY